MSTNDEVETSRRDYGKPRNARNPVPTVQQYREGKEEERQRLEHQNVNHDQGNDGYDKISSTSGSASELLQVNQHGYQQKDNARDRTSKSSFSDSAADDDRQARESHYPTTSQYTSSGRHKLPDDSGPRARAKQQDSHPRDAKEEDYERRESDGYEDTAHIPQQTASTTGQWKAMKHGKPETHEREVTDPVTHLPIIIHDFTDQDIENTAGRYTPWTKHKPTPQSRPSSLRGNRNVLDKDIETSQQEHEGLESVFPPPHYAVTREQLTSIYQMAILVGLGSMLAVFLAAYMWTFLLEAQITERAAKTKRALSIISLIATAGAGGSVIYLLQGWVQHKVTEVWEDEVWEAERRNSTEFLEKAAYPESTQWLNMILGSIWPLINPDLFASLADTLEDVMQASLPRFVRMISVEDLGQGSEALRILGVRWLPRGAAGQSVTEDGKLDSSAHEADSKRLDQVNENSGSHAQTQTHDADQTPQENRKDKHITPSGQVESQGQSSNVAQGMEAEEGDFVNVELAFAYRSRDRKSRNITKSPHIYLLFYLPGGIRFPVWVELSGIVGTLRARLQITPDPPFVALCTMTFLGQPKVDISCVPLTKRGLNVMDVPFISHFVQSAVDAAMAQYVAPKSKTLDLKAMLAGDDFKKDTHASGVLIVKVNHAFDFKHSDISIPLLTSGDSDTYVSVGWAKLGKPVWSTRVLVNESHPYWEEEAHMLVNPEELDADESLRVQLWDSDRATADDDLGRIEIPLKALIKDERSNGKMWERTDPFEGFKAGETMPGRLNWSVGYYSKLKLMDYQVSDAMDDGCDIRTVRQLQEKVVTRSERKLRETAKNEKVEIEQQKAQDVDDAQINIITSSAPSPDYPSGMLSVQIHQITGLALERLNKDRNPEGGAPDDFNEEKGDSLPNSYCTIILNHQKIYKTRTKPRNSKPFFNAATERFIRDWRTTSLFISVHDARVHEDDALLGIVYLPLAKCFEHRSRLNEHFPIVGGVGYGRLRVSLVFRSIQLQAPTYNLGWDYGTLEVLPEVSCSADLPKPLRMHRLKFRTALRMGKFPSKTSVNDERRWVSLKERPLMLPVRNRYSSNLVVEFRDSTPLLRDKTAAFSVLWFKDIPDEEQLDLELPVWKGDLKRAERCCLPDDQMGEKLGTLNVTVKLWRGLGKWHGKYARHHPEVDDVMEVLSCANDENDADELVGYGDWRRRDNDSSSTSESDSSDDTAPVKHGDEEVDGQEINNGVNDRNTKADSENARASLSLGGIVDEVKTYMRHKDQLHRRHRGIMQWKAPRTVRWVKHKGEHLVEHVVSKLEHHDRQPGVETEI